MHAREILRAFGTPANPITNDDDDNLANHKSAQVSARLHGLSTSSVDTTH